MEDWRWLVARTTIQQNQVDTKLGCPICLEDFELGHPAIMPPCLHCFHEECIAEWLNEQSSCPICRLELAPSPSPPLSLPSPPSLSPSSGTPSPSSTPPRIPSPFEPLPMMASSISTSGWITSESTTTESSESSMCSVDSSPIPLWQLYRSFLSNMPPSSMLLSLLPPSIFNPPQAPQQQDNMIEVIDLTLDSPDDCVQEPMEYSPVCIIVDSDGEDDCVVVSDN